MSAKERERAAVMRRLASGEIRQKRAAELLGIKVRQVKNLVRSFRARGDRGLVSGRRGRPSNNRLDADIVRRIEQALRERYADFGPTFAAEKLAEGEAIEVPVETVRQIQIRLGLHRPRQRKRKRVHQLRERRPRLGELIQIDGRQAENLIKMLKGQLAADRTSCSSPLANQVRLVLHTAAYWLLHGVAAPHALPAESPLHRAELGTLRLKLMKIAARVVEGTRRILVHLPTSCPEQAIFRAVARTLMPAGP